MNQRYPESEEVMIGKIKAIVGEAAQVFHHDSVNDDELLPHETNSEYIEIDRVEFCFPKVKTEREIREEYHYVIPKEESDILFMDYFRAK